MIVRELGAPCKSYSAELVSVLGNAFRKGNGSGVPLAVALGEAPADFVGCGVELADGERVGVLEADGNTSGLRLGAAEGSGTTDADKSTNSSGITAVLFSPSAPETVKRSNAVLEKVLAMGPGTNPWGKRGKPAPPAGPTRSWTVPSTWPRRVDMLKRVSHQADGF